MGYLLCGRPSARHKSREQGATRSLEQPVFMAPFERLRRLASARRLAKAAKGTFSRIGLSAESKSRPFLKYLALDVSTHLLRYISVLRYFSAAIRAYLSISRW